MSAARLIAACYIEALRLRHGPGLPGGYTGCAWLDPASESSWTYLLNG